MSNFSPLLQHLCSTLYLQKWFGGRGRDLKAPRLFLQPDSGWVLFGCSVNAPFAKCERETPCISLQTAALTETPVWERPLGLCCALEFKQTLWYKARAQLRPSSLPRPSWSKQKGPAWERLSAGGQGKVLPPGTSGEGINKQPHPRAERATVTKMKVIVNWVNARITLVANRTEGTQNIALVNGVEKACQL